MTRRRLSPENRRRELVGIGLHLLITKPLPELSVDEVAAQAGISRSLLFHYFPTKRDFLAAVVRAAAGRMLLAAEADGAGVLRDPSEETDGARIEAMIDGLLSFVERRREAYLSLLRTTAADEHLGAGFEEAQQELARRVVIALGRPTGDAMTDLAVRGWLSLMHETAIRWTATPAGIERAAIQAHLRRSLDAVLPPLGAAAGPSGADCGAPTTRMATVVTREHIDGVVEPE